jgi:hypothetical protein
VTAALRVGIAATHVAHLGWGECLNEKWSDDELRASVEAYVDMHRKDSKGAAYTKKGYYPPVPG